MKRLLQGSMVAALALGGPGCGFMTKMMGSMGATDGAAFTVDMGKYQVEAVELAVGEGETTFCPGQSRPFRVLATAIETKEKADVTLETRAESASPEDSRGKMDLLEFAMAARGGQVDRGVFRTDADPFDALLGYDLQATYRRDDTKQAQLHFDPVYSCIQSVGSSGSRGQQGEGGYAGDDGGGTGQAGGPGGSGGVGPRLVAHVSIVRTPLYDRVGIVRLSGDENRLTLFDLSTGLTVYATGGTGGSGGTGGDGGYGSDPAGPGGLGGPGGQGGPGGDGGEVQLVLDHRYPELAKLVGVDVSGGLAGRGGDGGYGGQGGAPVENCDDCEPGPDGAGGPAGLDGTQDGAPGRYDIKSSNVRSVFAELPAGIALRDDPDPVVAPPPSTTSKKSKSGKKSKKSKKRRR